MIMSISFIQLKDGNVYMKRLWKIGHMPYTYTKIVKMDHSCCIDLKAIKEANPKGKAQVCVGERGAMWPLPK
jgi:hypothetical protein